MSVLAHPSYETLVDTPPRSQVSRPFGLRTAGRRLAAWRVAMGALSLVLASSGLAQTTPGGNYSSGGASFITYCKACHVETELKLQNAAMAGGHISYAFSQNMAPGNPQMAFITLRA